MKGILIAIVVVIIAALGIYWVKGMPSKTEPIITEETPGQNKPIEQKSPSQTLIGKSVENRDIIAYHYGTGTREVLFVGGIHGGYEWNTALVAYQLSDYLKQNPTAVPANLKVTVIPVVNPDGLNKVVGTSTGNFSRSDVASSQTTVVAGRFNANNVDLNRNFDCDWQTNGKWQNKTVSGGSKAFSEPESLAIKNYIETNKPAGVVVWYSSAGGVYASSCHNGVSSETSAITKVYADASGYPAFQDFNFYEITGDMVNWLAKSNIPAISVLLTDHTNTEWGKNQKGAEAIIKYYSEK